MSEEPAESGASYSIGAVRISRRVLRTVIADAVGSVRGVAGLALDVAPLPPALGRPAPWGGIGLATRGNEMAIDLYLVAERGENLARVGASARDAVISAVEQSLGMRVTLVNVYVQDVA